MRQRLTIITPEADAWDAFVRAHPHGHLLQLSAWAALKEAFGWQSERVALCAGGAVVAGAQVLFTPLPLHVGTIAYLPFGGLVTDEHHWPALWQVVSEVCRRRRAVLLNWEPGFNAPPTAQLSAWGFQPSPQTIQPPNTILIDLDDDETMLARMNQGTRRKIRQAVKGGVRCYEAARSDLPRFTTMMQATGQRNAFGVHAPAYYQRAYELFVPHDAALILAEHQGDTLAGVFVFALGSTAWYLYGASADQKRHLMASYAAQWHAIQWARARGCRVYDMWGIPDTDADTLEAQFEQRSDGLWGVYGFKRGWGGRIARTAGAWDRPYQPLVYQLYRLYVRRRRQSP
jgi:peptidoglycan pentaglycine glycine transferase (the first glycine)